MARVLVSLIFRTAVKAANLFASPRVMGQSRPCGDDCISHQVASGSRARRVAIASLAAFCSILVVSHLSLCVSGRLSKISAKWLLMSNFAANLVVMISAFYFVFVIGLAAFLVRGFQQEWAEARSASIDLARRTVAFETLLLSPSAAALIENYEGVLLTEDRGAGVSLIAVRTMAYKLICRDRFDDSVDGSQGERLILGNAIKDQKQLSQRVRALCRAPLPPQLTPALKQGVMVRGFHKIASEILVRGDITMVEADRVSKMLVRGGMRSRGAISHSQHRVPPQSVFNRHLAVSRALDNMLGDQESSKEAKSIWSRHCNYFLTAPPSVAGGAFTAPQVALNPFKQVTVALAIKADELLGCVTYGDVERAGEIGRFIMPEPGSIKRTMLDTAFDFISETYSCSCCRSTRNFHPVGYPASFTTPDGKDIVRHLKRVICEERVSVARGKSGVAVDKRDVAGILKSSTGGVAIQTISQGRRGKDAIVDDIQVRLVHKFYDSSGLPNSGEQALFQDVGMAELLIAPIFFAKTFLKDADSDKRRAGARTDRPSYDTLYGARLVYYAVLVTICSAAVAMLSLYSACLLIASGSALGMAFAAFDILGAVIMLMVSAFAFCMSRRFFGHLDEVVRGIPNNFPAIEECFSHANASAFAVDSVIRCMQKCPVGRDFPTLEPIGGYARWQE